MVILTMILGALSVLIVALLVAAAFASDGYMVQADIMINKPQPQVFEYVKYLENQANYNKWVMMDPDVRKTFTGTDGTVGFHYTWESDNNQVGKGEQTITALTDKRVDYALLFLKPFEGKAEAYIEMEAAGGQTKVTWVFKGKRTFMMKVMHIALNLKKMLTKDLQTSLTTLKGVLEQK